MSEAIRRSGRQPLGDHLPRLLGERDGAALHPPLPVARGHGHRPDLVRAVGHEALEEPAVRPTEPGLQGEDAHRSGHVDA